MPTCEGCGVEGTKKAWSPVIVEGLCGLCRAVRQRAALAVWPHLIMRVMVDLEDFPDKDARKEITQTACFVWKLADAFTRGQKP